MAKELGKPEPEWDRSATSLRASINKHLWLPRQGRYGYFIDPNGRVNVSQEGSGIAFAILFGVARGSRPDAIITKAHIEPTGVADVYPSFPRYSQEHPGRHNVMVWPMVQGMWARAAAKLRNVSALKTQTEDVANLEHSSGGHFFEIYEAVSGKPNGGWQNGRQWSSAPDQTWSATAYLSMIFDGLFGMRFEANALRFEPLVPDSWRGATLTGIRYRRAILNIHLHGAGGRVKSLLLDGRKVREVPGLLEGKHAIDIYVH
jgi:glycogen debranching enzyme